MTEPDWRAMGDPLNDRLPTQSTMRVPARDTYPILARMVDLNWTLEPDERDQVDSALDEIDRLRDELTVALNEAKALRLKLAWTEQIAHDRGDENERLRPVVAAALAWADAEDEALTPELQDSTDALWDAVATFRATSQSTRCGAPDIHCWCETPEATP